MPEISEDGLDYNNPIRVKVSRKCYAESLVALAEEHGFDKHWSFTKNEIVTADCLEIRLQPKHIYPTPNHDLTYAQDLPQIEAWLQANAESGDECVCDENNQVIIAKDKEIDCPDCTDEPDHPNKLRHKWVCEEHDDGRLMEEGYGCVFCNYYEISELEQELEDVREGRDQWERIAKSEMDYSSNLEEQIEEAREKAEDVKDRLMVNELYGYADHVRVLLEILSPDSDEGDGFEAKHA